MIELAKVRLEALGHAGNLEVPDPASGQVLADLHCHITLDNLAVVQIELNLDVVGADLIHQLVRIVLAVQEKAGDVARVDRLQQQVDAVPCRSVAALRRLAT